MSVDNLAKPKSETCQITWIILNAVKRLKVGKIKLAQFLKGSKSKEITHISDKVIYGGLMWHDIPTITGFIDQLENIGLIRKNAPPGIPHFYSTYELTEAGEKVLSEKREIPLQIVKQAKPITVGDSEMETLRLIKDGKSVGEIARERNLVETTIYAHAFRLIINRQLTSKDVISEEAIRRITDAAKRFPAKPSTKELKELLPDLSYEEIRCALAGMSENGMD